MRVSLTMLHSQDFQPWSTVPDLEGVGCLIKERSLWSEITYKSCLTSAAVFSLKT